MVADTFQFRVTDRALLGFPFQVKHGTGTPTDYN
jgi:hypothetical protein